MRFDAIPLWTGMARLGEGVVDDAAAGAAQLRAL